MQLRRVLLAAVTLALVLGLSGGLQAQTYTGAIVGRAADQTGGVLPGVTVTTHCPWARN